MTFLHGTGKHTHTHTKLKHHAGDSSRGVLFTVLILVKLNLTFSNQLNRKLIFIVGVHKTGRCRKTSQNLIAKSIKIIILSCRLYRFNIKHLYSASVHINTKISTAQSHTHKHPHTAHTHIQAIHLLSPI